MREELSTISVLTHAITSFIIYLQSSFIYFNLILIRTPSKSSTSMIKNSSATSSKRLFALRRQQQGDLRVAPTLIVEDAIPPTNVVALAKPSASRNTSTKSSRWKSRRSIPLLVKVPSSSNDHDANNEAKAPRTDPSEGKKNAWDSVSSLGMQEGPTAHKSSKSLNGASKSLARLQNINESSTTKKSKCVGREAQPHTVQKFSKSTRSLHVHHRVHTPPMESISTSMRKKSKSPEHHRSSAGSDGHSNDKGSSRNSPAHEGSDKVEELMKQVQDLKAQLKEKTETIVKMEVSLDIANDTICALSKKIKHERHERPTHRHSAFDLYQERLKPQE